MWPSSHSEMCYGKSSYGLRLLPNPLSSQLAACLLEVFAKYSCCSSVVVLITLIILVTSSTLALILILVPVLIRIASILSQLLWIFLIHILCLLYCHLPRLTLHSIVLSSVRIKNLPGIILNRIHYTLLLL